MTRVTKTPLTGPKRTPPTSAAAGSAGENATFLASQSARFRLFATK